MPFEHGALAGLVDERVDDVGWVKEARTPVNSATRKIDRNGGTCSEREHDQQHERQEVDRRDVEDVGDHMARLVDARSLTTPDRPSAR